MNKTFGSILVAAGTAIGAGMLALPLVTAGMGYTLSAVLFLFVWALVFYSALLTLEVNLAFKAPHNSYATMARATLGRGGQYITVATFLLLLYALSSAYITGGASLFETAAILLFGKTLPNYVNVILFTLMLGFIVSWGTRAVDLLNRGLFSIKTILFIAVVILFFPQVNYVNLLTQHESQYIWAAAPVILTAFGFHIVLPSLVSYLGPDPKQLRRVLLWGSLLPLIIYLVWLAAVIGILPRYGEYSFQTLAQTGGSVGELIIAINNHMQVPWLSVMVNAFANVALITSCLGIALSLFDFLRDKQKGVVPHRAKTALYTFVPPLCIALFYPNGFVQLLSYASIFAALILIILPGLMVYKLRGNDALTTPYQVWGARLWWSRLF